MTDRIRWGILGTGNIAAKFAAQLSESETGQLVACGSRTQRAADAFAQRFGGRPYRGYESLLADPQVDAIYLTLPNSLHCEWTLHSLDADKHVLCEKPLAPSVAEAERMFERAESRGKVLIEAFMYRCHPAIQKALQLVHSGAIGPPKLIRTHFTFQRAAQANDVRYQADLAGGCIMDVGCYCINFARALCQREPDECQVIAHQHDLGVEDYAAGIMSFGGDTLATWTCGMTVQADRTTVVAGTEGYLSIDTPWFPSGDLTLVRGDERQSFFQGDKRPLYALEADCFAACVHGKSAPWLTRDDTLGNVRVLECIRQERTQ